MQRLLFIFWHIFCGEIERYRRLILMADLITTTLPAATMTEIMGLIAQLEEKLAPLRVALSAEERQGLPKMGDKSEAFVRRCLEIATQDDSFLPRSFDVAEFRTDVEAFTQTQQVELALSRLLEGVTGGRLEAGSEAFVAALDCYSALRRAGLEEQLGDVGDALVKRFTRRPRAESEAPKP
jgi:hypothetical protein